MPLGPLVMICSSTGRNGIYFNRIREEPLGQADYRRVVGQILPAICNRILLRRPNVGRFLN
jgi:hypothetical protein